MAPAATLANSAADVGHLSFIILEHPHWHAPGEISVSKDFTQ